MEKERNGTVDAIRGIAMLMVVLGHTMTGCTVNSETSALFNIIWSLQMPLFMLISGYVNRYSRKIDSAPRLFSYMKRRTVSYILPFAVWSFIIRGLIFRQYNFFNIKWLVFHMDSGYWFLFTLWTISMVFGVSEYFSERFVKRENCKTLLQTLLYAVCAAILLIIGITCGMSFLGMKLTLYYMPFYYAGFLFGKYQDVLLNCKHGSAIVEIFSALMCLIYVVLINNFNFFTISENIIGIFVRITASMSGSIFVCYVVAKMLKLVKFGGGGTLCRSTFTGNISCPLSSLVTGSVGDKTCVSISCGNAACSGELSDNAGTCRVYGERPERELCIEGDAVWEGKSNTAASFVKMTGTHSMEIYLIHGFFLSLLKTAELPLFGSVDGIIICILNYFAALALSCCMIAILKYNKYLYGFCFFKKCK